VEVVRKVSCDKRKNRGKERTKNGKCRVKKNKEGKVGNTSDNEKSHPEKHGKNQSKSAKNSREKNKLTPIQDLGAEQAVHFGQEGTKSENSEARKG